ncbi:hypothetical protein Q5752_005773 [Cryptotrichosporon argae]
MAAATSPDCTMSSEPTASTSASAARSVMTTPPAAPTPLSPNSAEVKAEDEVDELQDDNVGDAAAPRAPAAAAALASASKTRKSSCAHCHVRKIKCSQDRPSCASCLRKGHVCRYAEDAETPTRLRGQLTVVSATNPNEKFTGDVPTRVTPTWAAGSSSATGSASAGVSTKRKKKLDREKIVNGYGSSSDEESSVSVKSSARRTVDGDIADLVGDATPVDKHDIELLELASAPPPKKKPRASQPPVSISVPRPAAADPYSAPVRVLLASLPSAETCAILLDTFFADPFLTEGFSLLQARLLADCWALLERPPAGRLDDPDATILACVFAMLAAALRVLPAETSRLLLASGRSAAPRSVGRVIAPCATEPDPTPLDQRYVELSMLAAQLAEQHDKASLTLVVQKLVLFRLASLRPGGRTTLAAGWLAQAIKTAQVLGLTRERDTLPQIEREVMRRLMWALYVEDRQFAFDTTLPYSIVETHMAIHIPSPIAEQDLMKISPDAPILPPHATEAGPTACTALFIHTHLARRTVQLLDSFAVIPLAGTPQDLIARFDASLDAFQDALPPYLRLHPLTDTRFDVAHQYLAPHRVRLHVTLLALRTTVHRPHVATYLAPSTTPVLRAMLVQLHFASLRAQRSARVLDPKLVPRLYSAATVFEAVATLALVMHVERALGVVTPPDIMAMRADMADGCELLDGADDYAQAAATTMRRLTEKLDAAKTMNILTDNHTLSPPLSVGSGQGAPEAEPKAAAVSRLVEGWAGAGIDLAVALRDPRSPAWNAILSGM